MTVSYTARFRFGIPDFLSDPWHEEFEGLVHQIDNALYQLAVAESVTFWANSTDYDVSDLVIDNLTGVMYTCGVSHTSPASPTTFAQDRVANPTRWNATANIPQQRGNWVTGTTYVQGDFVIESQRYAVCLVGHVAGADFDTDVAAGKWAILIDLSTLGVGINTEAEATVASAATVDLGAISSSRIFITGTTNISSFGIVANQIKILRYEDVLDVVHHATDLILPAGANRTTDAGGYQIVTSNSAGKWREVNWHPGSGPSAVPVASTTQQGVVELATTAETQALVDTTRVVTPAGLAGALTDLSTSILNTIRDGVTSTLDTLAEIATALNLLAPKANPTFTGTVTVPTQLITDDSTKAASTAFVHDVADDRTQAADGTSLVLISSLIDAAGAGSLVINAGNCPKAFDGTFRRIVVHLIKFCPATNDAEVRMTVNGVGGAADYQWGNVVIVTGVGGADLSSNGDTSMALSHTSVNAGLTNSSDNVYSGEFWMDDLDVNGIFKPMKWEFSYADTAFRLIAGTGGGRFIDSDDPITSLSFFPSSGNWTSAQALVYGVKDA